MSSGVFFLPLGQCKLFQIEFKKEINTKIISVPKNLTENRNKINERKQYTKLYLLLI